MGEKMKILVTGAKGFIGKNLVAELCSRKYGEIFEFDLDTPTEYLNQYCGQCEFVFHLAGVNRPQNPEEFMQGNFGFTSQLLDTLKKYKNPSPVLLSSSIQALLDNPYGQSKKAGEDLLFEYGKETGTKIFIYRFPNVFGKWCRPNYNSAVATFCNNIAAGLPITVNDPSVTLQLVYIDDVVKELIQCLEHRDEKQSGFSQISVFYRVSLEKIVDLLMSFKNSRGNLSLPDSSDPFAKKLYATYLSYLPTNSFSYPLLMHADARGSFTELFRTEEKGQISVNVTKPGITKGNHWHHTKNEKFLVVSGNAIIRFRKIDSTEILEYRVGGDKLEVVDIPPGYTHNISNVGKNDLVTLMWANECYDPTNPDTFPLEV